MFKVKPPPSPTGFRLVEPTARPSAHRGSVLARLGEGETGVSVVEIDVKQARNKKITSQDDRFDDRRPDLYGKLLGPTQTPLLKDRGEGGLQDKKKGRKC